MFVENDLNPGDAKVSTKAVSRDFRRAEVCGNMVDTKLFFCYQSVFLSLLFA